jgi:hypothetical protein
MRSPMLVRTPLGFMPFADSTRYPDSIVTQKGWRREAELPAGCGEFRHSSASRKPAANRPRVSNCWALACDRWVTWFRGRRGGRYARTIGADTRMGRFTDSEYCPPNGGRGARRGIGRASGRASKCANKTALSLFHDLSLCRFHARRVWKTTKI